MGCGECKPRCGPGSHLLRCPSSTAAERGLFPDGNSDTNADPGSTSSERGLHGDEYSDRDTDKIACPAATERGLHANAGSDEHTHALASAATCNPRLHANSDPHSSSDLYIGPKSGLHDGQGISQGW